MAAELADTRSTIIDSVSISPQECMTLDLLYGAGSLNGMIGDAIFHCHLYPHFHEGMWTLLRVFDRRQRGEDTFPDGTPIEPPPAPAGPRVAPGEGCRPPRLSHFVNGTYGQRPLQPPLGILSAEGENQIDPTPLKSPTSSQISSPEH